MLVLERDKLVKKQAGVTLLELLVAISIMSSIIVGLVSIMDNQTNDTKAAIVALHTKTVGNAANQYIKDNYSTITTIATANSPVLIRISDLIAGGYLSAGYSVTNPRNQSTCVLVLQPTSNNLIGMVVTQGGDVIDDITLGEIAAGIGGDGGAIYSTSATGVRGAMGGWYLDMTTSPYSGFYNANNLGQNCDGTGGSPPLDYGHPAMALWFSNGTTVSATLYRNAVPGNPTLNTMNTPILMGAGTVETVGQACSTNGAIATDSTGSLLSCQSGTWQKPSSSGFTHLITYTYSGSWQNFTFPTGVTTAKITVVGGGGNGGNGNVGGASGGGGGGGGAAITYLRNISSSTTYSLYVGGISQTSSFTGPAGVIAQATGGNGGGPARSAYGGTANGGQGGYGTNGDLLIGGGGGGSGNYFGGSGTQSGSGNGGNSIFGGGGAGAADATSGHNATGYGGGGGGGGGENVYPGGSGSAGAVVIEY